MIISSALTKYENAFAILNASEVFISSLITPLISYDLKIKSSLFLSIN